MNPEIAIALTKLPADKTARENLSPGTYPIDATIRVKGQIKVGEDYSRTPTASIPLLPTMALLIKRMGFQRDKALALLTECVTEALQSGEKVEDMLESAIPGLADALKRVQDTMSALPTVSVKGPVTAKLTVEYVSGVTVITEPATVVTVAA